MSSKRGRVNQYERHVGSHHRVYGLTSPDGSGKIVYSIGWIEKCRLDSFIEIYLRDGNSLHDVNSMTPSYESPELAEVRRRLILDYDNFKSKSHDQFVYKLSIVECFYLELLPQSDFAIYIIKLRSRLILGEDGIFSGNPVCEYINLSYDNWSEMGLSEYGSFILQFFVNNYHSHSLNFNTINKALILTNFYYG